MNEKKTKKGTWTAVTSHQCKKANHKMEYKYDIAHRIVRV